jgi:hypothetical protein
MDQPSAEDALKKLEPLVGKWRMMAAAPGGQPWPGEGRTTFEWHESGAHLIESSTVDMPQAPDGVSIIGCDAANGTYYQLYSDGLLEPFEGKALSEWRTVFGLLGKLLGERRGTTRKRLN